MTTFEPNTSSLRRVGGVFCLIGILALTSLVLAGCTSSSGLGRWSGANREDLQIEGEPYRVVWLRTTDGVDAHAFHNSSFTLLPDKLLEKRRTTDAMRVVARRECGSDAEITADTNIELTFEAQFRCIQAAPVAPAAPTGKRRSQRS